MSVTFPRLLGVLAAVWTCRGLLWGSVGWSTVWSWAVATGLCGVAAVWLLTAKHVRVGAALLTGACVVEMLARPMVDSEPVILLAWIGAIVLITEGEPRERAFLLRVCTATIYAFAAASKTNPSWLAGEGVRGMAIARELLGEPLALLFPLAVILVEAWMALGLWFRSTRRMTAATGIGFHLALITIVSASFVDVLALIVLNLGLVAMYPAFWYPLRASDVLRRSTAEPAGS